MPEQILLSTLLDNYTETPGDMPKFYVERLCAKFHLAKCFFVAYDAEFKRAATETQLPAKEFDRVVLLIIAWNEKHRDWKTLNALLTVQDRFDGVLPSTLERLARHKRTFLCNG